MFKDQTAIVTGGSKGIGKGCVELFASQGANVVVADIDDESGIALVEQIKEKGGSAVFIKTNVSNYENVEEMVSQTIKTYGQIDILINNAGNVTPPALCTNLDNDIWQSILNVHINGTFYCTKLVAREMIKNKYGRIVNLSSVGALMGLIGNSSYCAAKGAIVGFTISVAKELAPHGITVNAVQPGHIRSNITSALYEVVEKTLIEEVPLGRVGEPDDVAPVIAFLASPQAGYVTGTCVKIDGGCTLSSQLDKFMENIVAS